MRAGRLRERITLQQKQVIGVNDFNEDVLGWVAVATVAADKQDVSDGERVRAAQEGATITARFQIRASAQVAELSATWRLVHHQRRGGDKVYDVKARKDLLSKSGAIEGYEITAAAQADTP